MHWPSKNAARNEPFWGGREVLKYSRELMNSEKSELVAAQNSGHQRNHLHPLKSNIDTQNDGFLDVSPFKHGDFGYLC